MEKLTHTPLFSNRSLKLFSSLVLFCMVSFSSYTFAAPDTTVFRIKVLQDSVYAGDTIDVDFYIGGASGLNLLNLLNKFEIEIATDTSLIHQERTQFTFDYASLSAFFRTTISGITTLATLDPILGNLNIQAGSGRAGSGDAHIGRGKYIVQDNVAGRQSMEYSFTKAISMKLLGILTINNPVKVIKDSVIVLPKKPIIKKPRFIQYEVSRKGTFDSTNEIKIFPNPSSDYIYINALSAHQYKLMSIDGNTIFSDSELSNGNHTIDIRDYKPGMYILMIEHDETWSSFKIIKQ